MCISVYKSFLNHSSLSKKAIKAVFPLKNTDRPDSAGRMRSEQAAKTPWFSTPGAEVQKAYFRIKQF